MFSLFKKFKDVPGNLTEQMANTRLRYGVTALAPHIATLKASSLATVELLLPEPVGPAVEPLAFETRLKELSDLTHAVAKLSQALVEKTREATLSLRCTLADIDRGLWNLKGTLATADKTNFLNAVDEMERIRAYIESIAVSVDRLKNAALRKNDGLVYAGPLWLPPIVCLGVAAFGLLLLLTSHMVGVFILCGGLFATLSTLHDFMTR
jgi:hypothetical protein